MKEQICYLCGSENNTIRPGSVRDNSEITILECTACGLVYLSSSNHLADSHYETSGMHDGKSPDIKKWLSETKIDDERRYQFMKPRIINKTVLDFGCGIGGFLELAKESAINVAGVELEKALQPSFRQRELSVFPNLKAVPADDKWDLITAFHVVEHLPDPRTTLRELSRLLKDEGEIIIEVPNSNDSLLVFFECKPFQCFTYWSQHLFLYNKETLRELAVQAGMKINWINFIQRYPLSNHLYWLANGKPGGHEIWGKIDNDNLNSEYESQLAEMGNTDTLIASLSKV